MTRTSIPPDLNSKCALCGEPISPHLDSREHIIPAALGGHRTIISFICITCNNEKGNTWDADLAAQLNWFSVALNIRRERGAPPRQQLTTSGGKRYWLHADGAMESAEPPVRKEKTESGHRFSFSLSSKQMARTKVLELAARYPEIDPEAILETVSTQIHFIDEPVSVKLHLTGDAFKSIVKTALAMAHDCGLRSTECDVALNYLRGNQAQDAWSAFYDRDLVKNRPAEKITHTVALLADPDRKVALVYVEYFSAFRYLVRLTEDYGGPPIDKVFAFDPVTWAKVDLQIDLSLSAEEAARCLNHEAWSFESAKRAFDYSLPIALQALDKRQFNQAIRKAIEDGFEAAGVAPGGQLPPEKYREFSAFVSQRAAQYLVRSPRNIKLTP